MEQPFPAYKGQASYVFVCYSHDDADVVYTELAELQAHGFNIWYDEGIEAGHVWAEDLACAITDCAALLFFASPASMASEHCANEVQFAVARSIPVLTVQLAPVELPPHLELSIGHRQAIAMHGSKPQQYRPVLITALTALIEGTAAPVSARPVKAEARKKTWLAAATMIVAATLAILWWTLRPQALPNSVAVLPFDNYTAQSADYLANGIADGLISQLGKISSLRVASRASSFALKNELARGVIDMGDIRARLNVKHVLEGSIRAGADDLLVDVRLVDATSDVLVWSQQWDTNSAAVLEIQSQIAAQVAAILAPGIDLETQQNLSDPPTLDAVAYTEYLQGREQLRRWENPELAEASFNAALALDDTFAQAHAGLCEIYIRRYAISRDPIQFVKGQKRCHEALELEPDLWEVRLSLGVLFRHSGDYERSLAELQQAVLLKPDEASTHAERGLTLRRLGRWVAAETALVKAIELEPGFWGGYVDLGNFYYHRFQYDRALEVFREAEDLSPGNEHVMSSMATVELAVGRYHEALTTYLRLQEQDPSPNRTLLTNIGTAFYYLGCFEEAAIYQKQATALAPRNHRSWGRLAESCRLIEGGTVSAQSLWRHAIDLAIAEQDQSSWDTKGLIAVYQAHLGETEAAARNIDAMWAANPEHSMAHFYTAIVHAKAGNRAASEASVEQSLASGFPPAMMASDPDVGRVATCDLVERLDYDAAVCTPAHESSASVINVQTRAARAEQRPLRTQMRQAGP